MGKTREKKTTWGKLGRIRKDVFVFFFWRTLTSYHGLGEAVPFLHGEMFDLLEDFETGPHFWGNW